MRKTKVKTKPKITQKQKQKQSVSQHTNIKINLVADKSKSKARSYRPSGKKESSQSSQPNIITTISNPQAVPTNYQLPIYYQNKPAPSPFITNTPPLVNVAEPLSKVPNEKNEIPIVNKQVPIDPTPLSGAVPASFIPQEAPELVKTGGDLGSVLNYDEEISAQKKYLKKMKEFTTYNEGNNYNLPEVEGEYLTEAQALPVRARKKYEYKPETIARRKAKKEEQNVSPLEATKEPNIISPLEVQRNKTILDELLNKAETSRQGQQALVEEMKLKDATYRNKIQKNRPVIENSSNVPTPKPRKELSQNPKAVYQRNRREKLKSK